MVENEKTSVPGALDNNRGMCLHPSRGVSADRGRPAACDRASPADSSASQTGARRARVEPAPRDTLAPVGARLGPKNNNAMNSDAASRTIAHGARLGFRGHRGEEERRESGDLNRHRRTLMCFTFRAGRASRSGSRASRSARAALAVCLSHLATEAKTSGDPNFFPDCDQWSFAQITIPASWHSWQ